MSKGVQSTAYAQSLGYVICNQFGSTLPSEIGLLVNSQKRRFCVRLFAHHIPYTVITLQLGSIGSESEGTYKKLFDIFRPSPNHHNTVFTLLTPSIGFSHHGPQHQERKQ